MPKLEEYLNAIISNWRYFQNFWEDEAKKCKGDIRIQCMGKASIYKQCADQLERQMKIFEEVQKLTPEDKEIVGEFVEVIEKYKHLGPLKIAEAMRKCL